MTLILVLINEHHVIQVSDRRLTRVSSGNVQNDDAVKCLIVDCIDARFSITFTGLATVGSFSTDKWLANYLTDIKAGHLAAEKIFAALVEEANRTFSNFHTVSKSHKGLKLVLAGYGRLDSLPFVCTISNIGHEMGNNQIHRDAADRFSEYISVLNPGVRIPEISDLLHFGASSTITPDIRRQVQRKVKKRFYFGNDAMVIARDMANTIRWANKTPRHGKVVGEKCLYAVVPRDTSKTLYGGCIPESSSMLTAPHFIGPGVGLRDLQQAIQGDMQTVSFWIKLTP